MLATPIFKEIFSEVIEYLVERVQNNYALQVRSLLYIIVHVRMSSLTVLSLL